MNSTRGDTPEPKRRLPKGPLIIILLVLLSVLWVYWLSRTTPPRPLPEIPPLQQLPLDLQPEPERKDGAAGEAREQP